MYRKIDECSMNFEAVDQLHRAAQFISLTGKNLLKQEDDDSNTNMVWNNDLVSFAGHWIEGIKTFRVELDVIKFELVLTGLNYNQIVSMKLDGRKKDEIFNWLKLSINNLGQDSDRLKYIDHYELPEHEIDEGVPFKKPDIDSLKSIATYFYNADTILKTVTREYGSRAPVNIWPHHFDIGAYIPVESHLSKAIGIGMAIPDTIVNDFYFYQYGVSDVNEIDYANLEPLSIGKWFYNGWSGGALGIKEIAGQSNQEEAILNFFDSGKTQLLKN